MSMKSVFLGQHIFYCIRKHRHYSGDVFYIIPSSALDPYCDGASKQRGQLLSKHERETREYGHDDVCVVDGFFLAYLWYCTIFFIFSQYDPWFLLLFTKV